MWYSSDVCVQDSWIMWYSSGTVVMLVCKTVGSHGTKRLKASIYSHLMEKLDLLTGMCTLVT